MAVFGKPTKLPEWASGDAADVVEPTAGEKSLGWTAGQTPPAPYMNWLMGGDFGYFPWLQYVSTFEQQALTWPERQTLQKGFAASGQRSTVDGLDVTSGATVAGGLEADGGDFTGPLTGQDATFTSVLVNGAVTATSVVTNTLGAQTGALVTMPGMSLTLTQVGPTGGDVTAPRGHFSALDATTYTGAVSLNPGTVVATGALLNGWTGASTGGYISYRKNPLGQTLIDVRDMYGGKGGSGFPLTNIPAGFRPPAGGTYVYQTNIFNYVSGTTGQITLATLVLDDGGNLYLNGGGLTGLTISAPGFRSSGAGTP